MRCYWKQKWKRKCTSTWAHACARLREACTMFHKTRRGRRGSGWRSSGEPQGGRQAGEWGRILIPLQMAGSVWKSKHFKMKSSNDWSNDHGHTLGKHIQVEEQPHKKLPVQPKAPHLPAAATLCWMHRDFTLSSPDCCLRRSVEIPWCKSDATIHRCWHIKSLLRELFYL